MFRTLISTRTEGLGNNAAAQRVLIYRIGSLGDTIVALPCFHLIATAFPNARRILLTNFPVNSKAPAASEVLGDSGLIHGYLRYEIGTRNPLTLLRLGWQIARYKPDVLVYLMPERFAKAVSRDALFFRVAGVRRIVGLPDPSITFRKLDPQTGFYNKESSRLAESIRELGDADAESLQSWDLRLNAHEQTAAIEALKPLPAGPLVVCGPGTKWQSKDWGTENWYSLLSRLSREFPDHNLAFVGAKEDSPVVEELASAWSGKSINLCGRLSPRETAAVLKHASLFLGPDSGPMHLAALSGVPCAIAFSAQGPPGVWFPIGAHNHLAYHRIDCAGCQLKVCIDRKKECLQLVTVEEMYHAAHACLTSSFAAVRPS